jgi:hypothetical protein
MTDDLQKDLDAGRVVLGGCIVSDDDPSRECNGCGSRFGNDDQDDESTMEWLNAARAEWGEYDSDAG